MQKEGKQSKLRIQNIGRSLQSTRLDLLIYICIENI